ncbi:hypothetical protein HHK36_009560 [Tetracentron sinense]|uniref:Pentatricopeptide repeat-containing protein n=1 Tax=Tetracentron sinense TaxID=13715 RepID=A0A835DL43_TETSI|nr:hypothetical protein HHK36_009560 [Tetracentron sinense]
MAIRSLFVNLRRKCSINSPSLILFEEASVARTLSSGALGSDALEESPTSPEDDIKSRIFRLRFPKRSATTVLQKWIGEGNKLTISELRQISKELRKSQRYKHALEVRISLIRNFLSVIILKGITKCFTIRHYEMSNLSFCILVKENVEICRETDTSLQISEWMVTHEEFKLSDSDYAVRIDLMTKVFGIDAAERYFEGLPLTAKTGETYTALLHSYARAKLTEKAEELYERIMESNLNVKAVTYNEMMTLYMSVGQLEKISLVVEDLKRQKVRPDLFTYNLWISACAATMDIDGVRSILDDMTHDSSSNEGWKTYKKLTEIYITSSHLMNSESSLVETEKTVTQREWITYDFLIILHTGLGNKERIDQIWKSLRMTSQKMTSRNYICILSSYIMLGQLKEAGEVLDQWKQSTTTDFDISMCNRLLDAFARAGLMEKSEDIRLFVVMEEIQLLNSVYCKRKSKPREKPDGATKKAEMKRNRNYQFVLSNNLWLNSGGEMSRFTSVEMVYKEMMNDKNVELGWRILSTLFSICMKSIVVDEIIVAPVTAKKRSHGH